MTKKVFIELELSELEAMITNCVSACLKTQSVVAAPQPEKEFSTIKETALLLNVSIKTIRNYTEAGYLKSYKIMSRVLYRTSEVMEAISKRSIQKGK